MRSLLALAVVPLCAVGGQQLASSLLAPGQQAAREVYVARSRMEQLDLLPRMDAAGRRGVLDRLVGELERAPAQLASPTLLAAARRCRADPGRCREATETTTAAAWQARKDLWWSAGWQIAAAAGAGLVLAFCALVLVRRIWSGSGVSMSRGRSLAFGLALAGGVLGLGGSARQVQRAIDEEQAAWTEGQRGFWVTRARLALMLAPAVRRGQLDQAAGALEHTGIDRSLVADLRRVAIRCGRRCDEPDLLRALSKIHAVAPPGHRRRWLDRWLLWIAAALLLLVPTSARAGRTQRP